MINPVPGKDYKAFQKASEVAPDYKLTIDSFDDLKTDGKTNSYASAACPAVRFNADTTFIFIKEGKTEVKTGLFGMETAKDAKIITKADADENVIAKTLFVDGEFDVATKIDPTTTIYIAPETAFSSTTAAGWVYTVYDCVTGEAKEVTMDSKTALDGKTGFWTFKTDDKGITSLVGDYAIAADTATDAVVTGKYENSLQIKNVGERDAAKAIFVDLRAAKDIKVGKVTDIASMIAEKENVVIDVLFDSTTKAATVVFVR